MDFLAHGSGGLVGIIVLVILFKPFFGDSQHFFECVKFWLMPDIISMFRGEYVEDFWAELKLGFWLVLGIGAGICTSIAVSQLLT